MGTEPDVQALAEAVVDLGAITGNVALLVDVAAGSGADTMAVVKADAFGHGLVPVARAAIDGGATWLGVTSAAEAFQVRAAGLDVPVLAWMFGLGEDWERLLAADVDLAVSSAEHLHAIAESAGSVGGRAVVQLKVDTGLTRNGVAAEDWADLVARARRWERSGAIWVRGIWSHLAAADDPGNPSVHEQLKRFEDALAVAGRAGLEPELRHLANSAAILDLPETHYEMVRAGIALYGVEPIAGRTTGPALPGGPGAALPVGQGAALSGGQGLRRAMTLRARAINVKRVPAGTGVSYLHEYATPEETTVVLVPVGFADGVPRQTGNRGEVSIAGRRCRIAGRVAMDQFVVDAGDAKVRIGDQVVLFGPGDRGEPVVEDWARWAGTNAHEILTGIGGRVPRTYLPN